jgi:hypothetical protein
MFGEEERTLQVWALEMCEVSFIYHRWLNGEAYQNHN